MNQAVHIPPFDDALRARLQAAVDSKTKPLGALGRLDEAYATYRERMQLWADGPPEHRSR